MGVVAGVTVKGIFVMIPEGIEGFIDLLSLPDTQYEFDGKTTITDRKSGNKYSIGDEVCIEVSSADVSSGTVDFVFAENNE